MWSISIGMDSSHRSVTPLGRISREVCCVEKASSKGYILYHPIYITFLKGQNYRDGEQMHGCQRFRMGPWGGHGYRRAAWRTPVVLGPFCILTVVWVPQSCTEPYTRVQPRRGAGNVEYNRLHVSLSVSWLDNSFCKMSQLRGHKGSLLFITNVWDSPVISK